MGNYSKFFGAVVGAILSWGATKGLPAELTGPEMNVALTGVITSFVVWLFPANKPA